MRRRFLTLSFLTFRDNLHIFVGQSSSSFSSTVCFQSCHLSFHFFYIFPGVDDPSPSRLLHSLPRYKYNHVHHFVHTNLIISVWGNIDIWHTLAFSCMTWFLTLSFPVLPLIIISVTCNLFSSSFLLFPLMWGRCLTIYTHPCSSSPDSPFSLMSSKYLCLDLPLFLLPCNSISIVLLPTLVLFSSHRMRFNYNLLSLTVYEISPTFIVPLILS